MTFTIAGKTVDEPLEAVRKYVRQREREIREFDLAEREDWNGFTATEVLNARYIEPSIDGSDVQYFLDNGRDAPWEPVPHDARLVDADPEIEDGLYDQAEELYMHFYSGRPRDMSFQKIHKVLYFKRPHLIPLFDGRLHDIYEDMARDVSRGMRDVRRGRRGRLYWAAIREDLLTNADVLDEMRAALADLDEPESLGAQLSDVRLHDIVAWELVTFRR